MPGNAISRTPESENLIRIYENGKWKAYQTGDFNGIPHNTIDECSHHVQNQSVDLFHRTLANMYEHFLNL